MKIVLKRQVAAETFTHGVIFIDDVWQCFTIEDAVRAVKIAGETAIPAGAYRVVVTHSPHFGRDLPLLQNVPNFDGVRIHSGNSSADTEGCILVGAECPDAGKDWIAKSRQAFDALFAKITAAIKAGDKVVLEIQDAPDEKDS